MRFTESGAFKVDGLDIERLFRLHYEFQHFLYSQSIERSRIRHQQGHELGYLWSKFNRFFEWNQQNTSI